MARRSAAITRIAISNGLGPLLGLGRRRDDSALTDAEIGRALRKSLEEAGGVFVKLGQLLSTRDDVIPPEIAKELGALQQEASPAARDQIEPALIAELGRPISEVFGEFDWEPIGAASIGQVYAARLEAGDAVVVKVRRPGVAEVVERDLSIMESLAGQVERRTSWGRQYGIAALTGEFASNLRDELDYRLEARNAADIGRSLEADPRLHVPRIHDDLTTESLLVMEELVGETIGKLGPDRLDPAHGRRLADVLFKAEVQAMVDGDTFHADPHPGNVMLLEDGRLGLLDLGSAGRLDAFEQAAVADILMALHLNDPTLLRDAVTGISTVHPDADLNQLERALARLMAHHLGPGATPDEAMLRDMLSIVHQFGITLPASITAMFRALGTLAGTLEILSPGYPLVDAAQQLAGDQLAESFTPDRLGDMAKAEAVKLAPILQRLPRHVDRVATQLERGELTTRVSLFSERRDIEVVTGLVNRAVLAFVGASFGIVSTLLLRTNSELVLVGSTTLLDVLGYVGLVSGAVLLLRVVLEVTRHDPER